MRSTAGSTLGKSMAISSAKQSLDIESSANDRERAPPCQGMHAGGNFCDSPRNHA